MLLARTSIGSPIAKERERVNVKPQQRAQNSSRQTKRFDHRSHAIHGQTHHVGTRKYFVDTEAETIARKVVLRYFFCFNM